MRAFIVGMLVLFVLFAGCVTTESKENVAVPKTNEKNIGQIIEKTNETPKELVKNQSYLPSKNITVSILVDSDSYAPTDEQLMEFFNLANSMLVNLTDTEMVLLSIKRANYTGSAGNHLLGDPLVLLYPAAEAPEYLIFLKSDKTSASYGGYSMRTDRSDVCNRYAIPKTGSQKYVAVGVIDWNHMFGSCGYDHSDPQHPVHISDVSIDGECRNTKNTKCVFNEKYGYYQCDRDDIVSSLYNSQKYYFAASTAVHELMHNFGSGVTTDHFATAGCDELMGGTDYETPKDVFEKYAGICPAIYEIFKESYKGC